MGVGVDIDSITKNTQAYIGTANVTADGDVLVQAKSAENLSSITAAVAVSINVNPAGFASAAVAGSAAVYVLNITTRAFIGNDPDNPTSSGSTNVQADGSILVAASETTALDLISGRLRRLRLATVGAVGDRAGHHQDHPGVHRGRRDVGALGLGSPIQRRQRPVRDLLCALRHVVRHRSSPSPSVPT